ncbi:phage shock protein A [Anaeromicropila herbilytica]|uniref:Phage shock protein A n=2 Tax=Anaeromicropila herbilytica TaxID=2785025 RepID=A0A7R7EJ36_9FIRM|nr:PspA/IM30 family protein [Anaeromicropila herbilytica]BCN29626.1 phage shock protein A [Anaeromicropila herbilytica]
MGILTRFKDIMASNINALLDKAEDPEKMIDQCLRNLNSDLGKVKSETASVMAEEQRTKRELDECTAEINKMQTYAMKAVQSGNDDDAKKFLERKATLTAKQSSLTQSYQLASQNAANMRQMHDKLVGDINQLESRKDMIKSKIAVAKTQERINSIGSSVNSANNSISAFDRMEEKADKMLDKANAMAELNKGPVDDMADLTAKYSDTSNIDDELAALKASLNQ